MYLWVHTHTHTHTHTQIYNHHHCHITRLAWISMTLSCHPSLLLIAPAGPPRYILLFPIQPFLVYVREYRSTLVMSSSLLL